MLPLCGETWGEAAQWAAAQLQNTDCPRLEAELLLSTLLGVPRTTVLAHPETVLSEAVAAAYVEYVRRRCSGEPLPYIRGHAEFFGLNFFITPDVLIPRPETELLVEESLAWMRERLEVSRRGTSSSVLGAGLRAADVGTGSGCIAVALATSAPGLHLYAIDLSSPALWVSQVNAERHGVADRITFLNGDLLTPLPASVDLIVSNPPYVAENEWSLLPSSVKREPTLALLGGPDGLNPLRDLLLQSGAHLRAGGLLLAEIGERQGAASLELARAAFPGAHCSVLPDLSGKDRVLKVRLE